jgi:hypothetical protein
LSCKRTLCVAFGGAHTRSQILPPAAEEPDEQEIPIDQPSQLNLLKAKAMKKWPDADSMELDAKVKDFTGLPIKVENYKAIITMLS